ncbi:hypothetical protein [Idiomarina piscisalsi]|uniref:Uncharacterized protein n=1 Tax=Idiomarina piscisalsi TaxID=1096243 RepID=A0A432YWR5_9GAMM|nr:hypothetical protein [Idiomarina piscisalsi]RUO67751.1 hypothetical protein CWI73_02525 [Idiomarina piscisalsi]
MTSQLRHNVDLCQSSPTNSVSIASELGFDGAINYKTDDLDAKLKELESAIDGLNLFFSGDNKGKLLVKL